MIFAFLFLVNLYINVLRVAIQVIQTALKLFLIQILQFCKSLKEGRINQATLNNFQ